MSCIGIYLYVVDVKYLNCNKKSLTLESKSRGITLHS